MARIVVVGLGPGGTDLLLPAARAAIEDADVCFARTERHPAVAELRAGGVAVATFDDVYDRAEHVDEVYPAIVDALLRAAEPATVVAYAVPGSPVTAERSVALLRAAAVERAVAVDVVPGLSFVEMAMARLGVDPLAAGLRVLDAHDRARVAPSGPTLVAQCDHPLVLADLKLDLLEHLAPETPVTVLSHLGLPDERIETRPLAELDRVEPDHLTSVFVDPGDASRTVEATAALARLLELATRLRAECPWDAEQTHRSLTRYLLEEAYEVVEAVEGLPPEAPDGRADPGAYAALTDELGDLLFQVVFHAVLAEEAGAFGMAEVAQGIHEKLVRRHPHVFAAASADSPADVMRGWEQIKKAERGSSSIVAGMTPGLPALLTAHKLVRKAASIGLDPGDGDDAIDRIRVAADALAASGAETADGDEALGDLLAAAVVLARARGVDAESALAGWARRFRGRFEALEALAVARGLDLATLEASAVEALWAETGEPPSPTGSGARRPLPRVPGAPPVPSSHPNPREAPT